MAGFGRSPFGDSPFGISDIGNDLLIQTFPEEYYDDTLVVPPGETVKTNPNDPLVQILNTYANSVFNRRTDVDNLITLIDPDLAPLFIVQLYGVMLGLDIDQNDPEFLQRSFLKYASQWLQIKSTKKSYEVRGLASGFNVVVNNFWRVDISYLPLIPLGNQFFLLSQYADPGAMPLLYVDEPPGTFAGTPTEEDPTYAKSAFLQVVFTVTNYIPNVDYNVLLDLIILKMTDVVGIHQELLPPEFQVTLPITELITASILEIDEDIVVFPFSVCQRFDIIPADVQPLDLPLSVSDTVS